MCQRAITHGTARHFAMITSQPIPRNQRTRRELACGNMTNGIAYP